MSGENLKFLVAVGFTEKPQDLIEKAVEVAKKYNAKLYAAHVVAEMPRLTFYYDAYELWGDFRDAAVAEAMDILKRYISRLHVHYRGIEPIIEVGDPGAKILEMADELNVDLIILGHHTRNNLAYILHQNSCEWIMRHSERPLLIFSVGADE